MGFGLGVGGIRWLMAASSHSVAESLREGEMALESLLRELGYYADVVRSL